MNSALLTIISLSLFYLGYKFYSKYIANKIYNLDNNQKTPAHEFNDGIDYVPTNKHVLFGHHFTSIAGAAPIIGPCIAVYWGWLPAILWVVIGTIFMGAVHDFGALVVSAKEKGKSIADISAHVINRRIRIMFLIFVMFLTWLVLAVFAMAIAGLFVKNPTSVLPINIEIIIALIMGYVIYKKKLDALVPSIIALMLLYVFVYLGTLYPISLSTFGVSNPKNTWIILLFIYSSISSLLPVWLLLQPRDYINSHQLFIGLGLLFLGVFVAQPMVTAPAIRSLSEPNTPSLFPLLFVTIACGAISGFHGLVASGTSSKQLEYLSDSRMVGYGGMIGEGTLALVSTIAAVAGISLVGQCNLPSVGYVADLDWSQYYDTWEHASGNKAAAFVLGGGALLTSLGISESFANTLMAVLVISFAATTLDTATRIQRFILDEFGKATKLHFLSNRFLATLVAVIPAMMMAFWNITDPSSGASRQAGWVLWPIFGASNQMLAALTLMVLTLYYWQKRKPILPLVIPMIIIMIITFSALIVNALTFFGNNNILFSLTIMLIALIIWMLYEGINKMLQLKNNKFEH